MRILLTVTAIAAICVTRIHAQPPSEGSRSPQQAAADKANIPFADSPPPDLVIVGGYSSELLAKAIQLGFIASVVSGAPYSAKGTTTMNTPLVDGTHITRTISYTIYRDSAGRLRREDGQAIWISDPVAQMTYILDPKARTARKVPLSRLLADAKRNAAKASSQTAVVTSQTPAIRRLGTQVVEGLTVEGTRTSSIIPAGQIGNDRPIETTTERWYSPDLQVVVMTRSNDPRTGETVFRLTEIQRAEPAASMFVIPAGFNIEPRN